MTKDKYVKIVKKFLEMDRAAGNYSNIVDTCRVRQATEGKVSVEFEVDKRMTNHFGTLHGGCTATMIDVLTTAALIATPKGLPGVSVDLHVTYLAAAKLGDTVQLDAEVIRSGKSMGFTRASLFRQHDKTLVATGLHSKAFATHAKFKNDES